MRTALVTGANRGLGLAAAQALAALQHRVVLGVRDVDAGAEALASLTPAPAGSAHHVLALDVGYPDSIEAALIELERERIAIDVLINNAGVLEDGTVLDARIETFDDSWAVNVRGPWLLIRALMPAMNARGFGRIVNVSSGGGSFGEGSMMAGHASYAVTKAALNALTVVSAEGAQGDVKVNAACPGWVRTRMGGEHAHRSVEEGSAGIVHLATLDAGGPSGGFFRDGKAIPW